MDAFHNLLREATNPRNASAAASSNGLPANGSLTQALQSAGGGAGMGMNPGMAMNGGTGLPMGMSLPMGMTTMSAANGSLAPIHRMSPLMGAGSPMFPSLNGTGGMIMPGMTPPVTATTSAAASSAASTTTAASSAKEKPAKTNTKKRKAPATTASAASSNNGDGGSSEEGKQPEEYLDPKAKRRAQIAKAARKHRQRQKDELIALRAKVKDLKEQIEVLQSSEPSEHNTELGWKQEAEQHAEIRARVDQENEFLRKTLMEQMKFIQRLQDYFTKQPLLNVCALVILEFCAWLEGNTYRVLIAFHRADAFAGYDPELVVVVHHVAVGAVQHDLVGLGAVDAADPVELVPGPATGACARGAHER